METVPEKRFIWVVVSLTVGDKTWKREQILKQNERAVE